MFLDYSTTTGSLNNYRNRSEQTFPSGVLQKGRIAVISLRFNPAFIQWLIGYAKAIQELGYFAIFVLDPAYNRFSELREVAQIEEIQGALHQEGWTHAIFLNPSIDNLAAARAFKAKHAKILYLYHEPWQISWRYLQSEGLHATAKAIVAHRFTLQVLKLADTVVLASNFGLRQYQQGDIRCNRNTACIPLLFDDEAPHGSFDSISQKQYFGYIGGIARSHGFDRYLEFMRYAFRNKKDMRFMIASRFPIPSNILADPLVQRNRDKLEVRCGRTLTSQEMSDCYMECFCVWNLYRRSTQSGVLPKAFMLGTPVIASRTGSYPEFVQDGVNGRFADLDDVKSIEQAADDIQNNLVRYATAARRSFLEIFFYRSQLKQLESVLTP